MSEQKYQVFYDVILSKRSMVLNKNFNLIKEASHIFCYWHNWQIKNVPGPEETISVEEMIKNIKQKHLVKLPKDTYIFCTTYENSHNWSHLWDNFQSLKNVQHIDGCLLHNHDYKKVNEFETHLEIMGHRKRKGINLEKYNYRIPKLVVPELACEPNTVDIEYGKWLSSKYHNKFTNKYPSCNLYLSRKNFKRNILNEKEILELLPNFEVFDGTESLEEHVIKFKSAKKIISYHGSLLKNLIFCKNKPDVLEFCPDSRMDICFMKHAIDCNLTNSYMFCPVISNNVNHDSKLNREHLFFVEKFASA